MRSWIPKGLGLLFVTMFLGVSTVPAFGQAQIGMDQDADLTCEVGESGVLSAVAGQQYSIDFVLENNAQGLVSLGLVYGTPDAAAVSGVNFAFNLAVFPGWSPVPQDLVDDSEVTPGFLAYKTANGLAWGASITDFSFANPTTPTLVGTLTFTAEVTGCISWGIDPGDPTSQIGSGFFAAAGFLIDLTACAPNVCVGGDPLAIDDTDPVCPIGNAKNGDSYSGATFLATDGVPPYSWTQIGLPSGMDINSGTGAIEGTPNDTPGNFPFTVTVTDNEGSTKASEERSCSITLDPADLAVNTGSPTCPLPNGKVGELYDGPAFTATGGVPPYAWDISSNNAHPGLAIGGATGKITGTPTVPGSRTYTIRVTDADQNTATRQCALEIDPADLAIDANGDCPLTIEINQLMASTTFSATGGVPPYTWDSAPLPNGVTINQNTGEIAGTPIEAGIFPNQVIVFDSDNPANQATFDCQIEVTVPALVIDDQDPQCPLPDGDINVEYSPTQKGGSGITFMATGGIPPYNWTQTGLPSGMDINNLTGEIEGTPSQSGSFPFTVFVDDSEGSTKTQAQRSCSLFINAPPLVIDANSPTCPIPDGTLNQSYDLDPKAPGVGVFFTATGGVEPYFWTQTGLPAGMDIGAKSGQIVGTPTDVGPFNFVVTVADDDEPRKTLATATRNCSIEIIAPDGGVAVGDDDKKSGAPGDEVCFSFNVESFSQQSTEYNMSASTSNGWTTSITGGTTLNLGPDGITDVEVCVTIPQDVVCTDGSDIVTLIVTRADDDQISDAGTAQLNVDFAKGVTVQALLNGTCTEPGDVKSDFFTVTNTGDCPQTYNLSSSNSLNWPQDAPKSISLDGGEAQQVKVDVTVPQDAQCDESSLLELIAECSDEPDVTASDDISVFVCPVFEVTVDGPANQNAQPGDEVRYCFTITNTGNCAAFYGAFLGDTNAWNVIDPLEKGDTELAPGESFEACYDHIVPEDALEGDSDAFCVEAALLLRTAEGRGTVFDSACVTTTVTDAPCIADFSLDFIGYTLAEEDDFDLKAGLYPLFDQGETFSLLFSLTNNSGTPDSYDIDYDTELGWAVELPFTETGKFTGKQLIEVFVTVPEDAECSEVISGKGGGAGFQGVETVTLAATSRNCDQQATEIDSALAGVSAICEFEIEFLTADQIGAPGDTLYYDFEVTNVGNCPANFIGAIFSIWDVDDGGPVTFKSAGLDPIEPGQSEPFTFGHIVPKTAQEGDEDKLEVCVGCGDIQGLGGPEEPQQGDFQSCDDVTSRVSTECEQGQPVLQLGGFQTVSYDGRFWEVQVAMINNGPGTAQNINAMMDSDIEWLVITDADCAYGDLGQGASSFGLDSYTFDLDNYPGGSFNVWFDVSYTDTCGTQYTVRLDPEFVDPTAETETGSVPSRMVLHQNVPNPFNPLTKITFDLPEAGRAHLAIYNAAGQQIKTLVSGHLSAGSHTFEWRGKDSRGKDMPSGTYFYSLSAEGRDDTRRMVLIR